MLNKCRNDVPKYGYDSRKNDSVMACYTRGGRKSAPPCSFHTVLQAAAYRVKTEVQRSKFIYRAIISNYCLPKYIYPIPQINDNEIIV